MLFVIRSLCKADPETTTLLVQLDGLKTIVEALEDFDPSVKLINLPILRLFKGFFR